MPDAENRVFVCDGPLAFDAASGKQVSLAEAVGTDGNVKEGYALLRDFEDEVHGEITAERGNKVFLQPYVCVHSAGDWGGQTDENSRITRHRRGIRIQRACGILRQHGKAYYGF
ncbi:MAG: hypothetical protein V8Q85_04525 [Christensenellales bacterium]